jgi:pyruvate formate lyase activating enzyme
VFGLIFNIERFAVHDGPGIRTLIFFKGCPLRCLWCDNPESFCITKEVAYYQNKCAQCYQCLKICPQNAIIKNDTELQTDRTVCDNCMLCTKICSTGARNVIGKFMTIEDVLRVVKRDSAFYKKSRGGVTLTGGEPLMQNVFVEHLLKRLRSDGIHSAIETTGYDKWLILKRVIDNVDLVLYDIKHMNPKKHKKYTGVSNKLILENIRKIDRIGIPLIIRVPIIPKYNDSKSNIEAVTKLADSLTNCEEIHLLPYHRLGISKYEYLGLKYSLKDLPIPNEKKILAIKTQFEDKGLKVRVDG